MIGLGPREPKMIEEDICACLSIWRRPHKGSGLEMDLQSIYIKKASVNGYMFLAQGIIFVLWGSWRCVL